MATSSRSMTSSGATASTRRRRSNRRHSSKTRCSSRAAAARAWAERQNVENLVAAREYASGEGPFQDRAAQGMLAGAFFTELYATVARWADWASEQIEAWPEDPADAVADPAELAAIARRADW